MPAQACKYRFGPFEVRSQTRELFKRGMKLKLRPQSCQVLLLLVERAPECVTREELRDHVWTSTTFIDFDHGLNTAVKELRGALADSASEPRYIETLPKLGYRLMVPVEREAGVSDATVPGPTADAVPTIDVSASGSASLADSTRRSNSRWVAVLILATVAFVCLFAFMKQPRPQSPVQESATQGRKMLAVLPFENLTGNAEQDYFSDGLTEEMITQLGRLDPQQFGVIARTSVMHYKHSTIKLDQIGRELGVHYVLEGSVRRDAQKVRINAQLIEVGRQTPIWTREYDRELSDLLATQAEIALEISDEIELTLGGPKRNAHLNKPPLTPRAYQAYDSYLKGLFCWNKRTVPGFQQAIEYFQQAIDKDPKYAPAYAGLANSYTLLSAYSFTLPSVYMPKARAAALRALQLDDSLPEAHVALALIIENYDWDWNASEKEYRRAIELNPNYATAHHWYAEFLTWRGRFAEALRESELARTLDPLSLIIASDHAAIFYYSRQYDQSIEQFRAIQEMDPGFLRAHMIVDVYIEKGQFAEALDDLDKWHRGSGDGPAVWTMLAYVYGRTGQKVKALEELRKLETENRNRQIDPAALALANLGVGDKEAAMRWLEQAYAQHSTVLVTLKVEPAYDPLRSDPRFGELLRRVGLAD